MDWKKNVRLQQSKLSNRVPDLLAKMIPANDISQKDLLLDSGAKLPWSRCLCLKTKEEERFKTPVMLLKHQANFGTVPSQYQPTISLKWYWLSSKPLIETAARRTAVFLSNLSRWQFFSSLRRPPLDLLVTAQTGFSVSSSCPKWPLGTGA